MCREGCLALQWHERFFEHRIFTINPRTPACKVIRMNHIAGPVEFAAAFAVSRETIGRLEVYASLLQDWQPRAPGRRGDFRHHTDT